MNTLHKLPCLDSEQRANDLQKALYLPRKVAIALGRSALEATRAGYYTTRTGETVTWREAVEKARAARISIRPDAILPENEANTLTKTTVQVSNESTLQAARRLVERGLHPLALNFANGVHPGGGFLEGSRAQEEVLCRSSALYSTLAGDAMYEAHRRRPKPDSTDWAIYSPDVPVFRQDDGTELSKPWPLSILTCAAPYAPAMGQPNAGDLLQKRIHRILAIAQAYGHSTLVLGAWGCGAFRNDPNRTARDFLEALENEYCGAFSEVIFAIVDGSPERKFLGPFREVFSEGQDDCAAA